MRFSTNDIKMTIAKIFVMRKTLLTILSFSIGYVGLASPDLSTSPGDSTKFTTSSFSEIPPAVKEELYRTFEGLQTLDIHTSTDPIIVPEIMLPDTVEEKRNHAHGLLEKVMSGQRFLESLDALSEIELPIGIVKSIGGVSYSILIDRIIFTSQGAMMEVYVSLELPQSGNRIAFNGKIPLSKDGGISGTARVFLLGDHPIQLSGSTLLTIKGTNSSYVEFDCSGFRGVSIEAEVQFSRDLIIPEDDKGIATKGNERVRVAFTTYVQSLNDLMVGVTIPPFQLKGLTGFGFKIDQAFMDWSDLANPPGLSFPSGYSSPFMETGSQNLWQGFFLKRLEVRLPASFAKRQNNQRVTIGVENMILDDQGFTGEIFAEHIIEAGDMNGWAYTLDRVELGLVTNQITGFQLAGKLTVPVVKDNKGKASKFGYLAQRGADGNYIFAVSVQSDLKIDLWAANVKLFTGSTITVTERDNKFYPAATLNGELTISLLGKGPKASFNSIRFERMIISSEAPHFTPGNFGFGREGESSSVSKFPVSFNNILVKSAGNRVGIGFDLTINIGGKPDQEGFGGTASLVVWAKQETEPIKDEEGQVIGAAKDNWKFDKVELSGIGINIKKPNVFDLAGSILFYDEDPVYGEGFKGQLKGSISKFGGLQADVLFGRTPAFRYWYADALVTLEGVGVPLMPGVLFATGFGGGFYSNVKQSSKPVASTIGTTQSGVSYIPEEGVIGIKAIMQIGTARKEAMNGDVGLEVLMNRHGGINTITFTGNANFMSFEALVKDKMKELAGSAADGKLAEKLLKLLKGQLYGSMMLKFDNVNDVFHGNLEIYVNVAGGIVRGISEGNKAGWAVMHFEKNDWYVLIGTPDQPIGLEVARIFKASSYFMLGKNLPGSPPPPKQVTEILGNVNLDYMRDMNALQSGMGFAFGLHFLVDTGDLRFLMFYGRFAAGTGIDFMLKDYGEQYHCAGMSGPMGINGWFANGQAYAFVLGKIGIKVNLKFYRGNFDILSIGAAAILQAKGPNPFWMKGIVGGYYRILGGMVKGKCKFEVTVGKDCKPIGEQNLLENLNMIAEITPANGTADIDVFNTPQIAFNIPVGEVFNINDMEGNAHSFRAVLDEFFVVDGSQRIEGTTEWNNENDVVIFDGRDLLPGEKKLKAKARLTFEERKNGLWSKVTFQGKVVDETAETSFETAKAPDYIPDKNVSLSYPLAHQANFYPNEYNQGFIQLKDGQPYLFTPNQEWIQKIRMTETSTNNYIESNLQYIPNEKRVSFTLPQGFTNSKVYRLEVLNIPKQRTVIDANVTKVERELEQGENTGTATLTTKEVEGRLDQLEVKSLYASSFRTSKYNSFTEKLSRVNLDYTYKLQPELRVFKLTTRLIGDERFDISEVFGFMGSKAMISMEAILEGNAWYENRVNPLVYEGYPLLGRIRTNRNTEIFGLPPVRNIHFENTYDLRTAPTDLSSFPIQPFTYETVAYNLAESVNQDHRALQHQVVNYIADNPSLATPRLRMFITEYVPLIRYGAYRVKIMYTIPGISQAPASYTWEFFNRVAD